MDYLFGIDIGGTKMKMVCMDTDYQVLQTLQWPEDDVLHTRDVDARAWTEAINNALSKICNEYHGEPTVIGISSPGFPNKDYKSIADMPGRLQDLKNYTWEEHLDFDGSIFIINDAKAALLAEIHTPEFEGVQNVIMLTIGTGVGGAAMVDGNVLEGHLGRAGHLGNMSVDVDGPPTLTSIPGGLDIVVGNCGLEQRTHGLFDDLIDLQEGYARGEPVATEYWLKTVKALAVGICSFVNVLDPEYVIIGGGAASAGRYLFDPLASYMELYEWRPDSQSVKIRAARQGYFAGAIGAGIFAYQRYSSL